MTKTNEFAQGAPCWFELSVKNGKAEKSFYKELFGWNYEEISTGGVNYTAATCEGSWVSGVNEKTPGVNDSIPTTWQAHFCVDNAHETAERIRSAGGTVISGPDDMDTGLLVTAQDPSGAFVGFWQPKTTVGFGVMDEPSAPSWCELVCENPQAVIPFYEKVLGVTAVTTTSPFAAEGASLNSSMPMIMSETYTRLMANGKAVAGIMHKPLADTPNGWTVYFDVDDRDAATEQIQQLGGQILATADLPDVGELAICADPEGAQFAVLHPAAH